MASASLLLASFLIPHQVSAQKPDAPSRKAASAKPAPAAKKAAVRKKPTAPRAARPQGRTGVLHGPGAEARLLEIYTLIGSGDSRQALDKAGALVKEIPNFQLAQLVYGDLLMAQATPVSRVGHVPIKLSQRAPDRLEQLRLEAERRLHALRAQPPANSIPSQFLEIPASTRHAIAVDVSRSRLYLFENSGKGMRLAAHHYVSIGKSGSAKQVEGDQRTPLGVYYITSRLSPKQLTDFYGVGALPLNYPNEYDRRMGRTGSGIWLHGVPQDYYARTPLSTDGCVVLANPELQTLLDKVAPRTTPVVIADSLNWVSPEAIDVSRQSVQNLMEGWRVARSTSDLPRLKSFYSEQFSSGDMRLPQWQAQLERETKNRRPRQIQLKDLAILAWRDKSDILVVTFGEVPQGQVSGPVKRQYWGKENGLWKIFYEGVIG